MAGNGTRLKFNQVYSTPLTSNTFKHPKSFKLFLKFRDLETDIVNFRAFRHGKRGLNHLTEAVNAVLKVF